MPGVWAFVRRTQPTHKVQQVKREDRTFAIVCALGLLLAVAWYLHSCARTEMVHGTRENAG